MSIRLACGVLELDTSTYHYKAHRPDQAGIQARIKDICETRVRYGYRRVHVLLRREGCQINQKKPRRIYSELGMKLRNKTPKRWVKAKLRDDLQEAVGPNDVWAMDFVHDQLATCTKIRILTIVDTFSRYLPVLDPRFSYRSEHVVLALEMVCSQIGYPKTIRSTTVPSSCPRISTCRPMPMALHWTSPDQGSQRIMMFMVIITMMVGRISGSSHITISGFDPSGVGPSTAARSTPNTHFVIRSASLGDPPCGGKAKGKSCRPEFAKCALVLLSCLPFYLPPALLGWARRGRTFGERSGVEPFAYPRHRIRCCGRPYPGDASWSLCLRSGWPGPVDL